MSENKRRYFRVNDLAQVKIAHVPRSNVRHLAEEIYYGKGAEGLVRAERQVMDTIAALKTSNPQVARALEAINDKIDELHRLGHGGAVESTESQPINFSVGGCRFCTSEAYSPSEAIDIRIRFVDHEEIRALALVKDIKKAKDQAYGQYEMAVQFRAISKAHAAIIEREVMRKQQEELKLRAEAKESA